MLSLISLRLSFLKMICVLEREVWCIRRLWFVGVVCGPCSLGKGAVLIAKTSSNVNHTATVRYSGLKTAIVVATHGRRHLHRALRQLSKIKRRVIVRSLAVRRRVLRLISRLPILSNLIGGTNVMIAMPITCIGRSELRHVLGVGAVTPVVLARQLLRTGGVGRNKSVMFAGSVDKGIVTSPKGSLCSASGNTVRNFMVGTTLRLISGGVHIGRIRPNVVRARVVSTNSVSSRSIRLSHRRCPVGHCNGPRRITRTVVCFLSSTSSFYANSSLILSKNLAVGWCNVCGDGVLLFTKANARW